MLALRGARWAPRPLSRRVAPLVAPRPQRRQFTEGLCEGFIELAQVMPYPDSFPTYATSLILMTVLSRLVQLPFAYKVCGGVR